MSKIILLPEKKTEYYSYKFEFNLNPRLLLTPLLTITSNFKHIKYIGVFNLPSEAHEANLLDFFCLLFLITLIKDIQLFHYIQYFLDDSLQYEEKIKEFGYIKLAEELIKDDYSKAILLFQALPDFVSTRIMKIEIDEEIISIANRNYFGIGTWIQYWHFKKTTRSLKNSNIHWLEKEALVTYKRYLLMYELYNLNKLFIHYNLMWILTEISVLIGIFGCKASSLNELYTANKMYNKCLNYFGDDSTKHFGKKEELFLDLYKYIDTLAFNTASENIDFDTNYYKPYIKARKTANSYAKKNLQLANPSKKNKRNKPGGKIGHTKNKKILDL